MPLPAPSVIQIIDSRGAARSFLHRCQRFSLDTGARRAETCGGLIGRNCIPGGAGSRSRRGDRPRTHTHPRPAPPQALVPPGPRQCQAPPIPRPQYWPRLQSRPRSPLSSAGFHPVPPKADPIGWGAGPPPDQLILKANQLILVANVRARRRSGRTLDRSSRGLLGGSLRFAVRAGESWRGGGSRRTSGRRAWRCCWVTSLCFRALSYRCRAPGGRGQRSEVGGPRPVDCWGAAGLSPGPAAPA